jgi:hypothetical protein
MHAPQTQLSAMGVEQVPAYVVPAPAHHHHPHGDGIMMMGTTAAVAASKSSSTTTAAKKAMAFLMGGQHAATPQPTMDWQAMAEYACTARGIEPANAVQ